MSKFIFSTLLTLIFFSSSGLLNAHHEGPDRPIAYYLDNRECPDVTEWVQCCCDAGAFVCQVPTFQIVCIPGGTFTCLSEFSDCQATFTIGEEGSLLFNGCEENGCCPENRICA